MHADFFWCFTVSITFFKQDQCIVRIRILNLFKNNFSWMLQKKIKHFAKKSFRVFNWTPSDTLKVFVRQKLFIINFQHPRKPCFVSIQKIFQQYPDVVNKIFFYSVKYFRICISKSFMRPCFFFYHPL